MGIRVQVPGLFVNPNQRSVQHSSEVERVLAIPRREWSHAQALDLAERLTAALKTKDGTMSLRPIQAVALVEAAQWDGGLFPIRVGGGKTLITVLLPRMFRHKTRPLILLPAHLIDKTHRELRELRKHWIIPAFLRFESYQKLSRINAAGMLESYEPDLIIADEAHYLKNPSAACTKRVARYLKPRRNEVATVLLSGTFINRSIREYAHLSSWALKKTNPLPEGFDVLDEWSRALDVNVAAHRRLAPGALSALRAHPVEDIRKAFRRRFVQSPGVVATQEPPLDIGLEISSVTVELPPELKTAYKTLRDEWTTPDEWPVEDGVAMWRHARELSNGFYSVWDPRPPDDWREARTEWARTSREIIKNNRRNLDTELQVRRAVSQGLYPFASRALQAWEKIGPTFKPNSIPVWVSDRTVEMIVGRADRTLLWTDRPALGQRLEELAGIPYYGQKGLDSRGNFIEDHDPDRLGSAVVSIDANKEGRNLQHRWYKNMILDVPPNGKRWEQMLGRTHRDGQPESVVKVEVLFGCIEDVLGFWRAVEDSAFAEDMSGQAQKLCHADLEKVLDSEVAACQKGDQWRKVT